MTRFKDVVEVFRQRAAEQDAVLGNRWELFWEALDSDATDGSIGATIATATPALGSLLSALGNGVLSQIVAGLASCESHPPTIQDYSAQKTLLDAHIAQKEKMILIAHSQGNPCMNVAYNYGVAKTTPGSIKAIHIAPASTILNGPATLADLDLVINALRVTSSVSPNNVALSGLFFR